MFPDGSVLYRTPSDKQERESLRHISWKFSLQEEELAKCNPKQYVTHKLPAGSLIELPDSFALKRKRLKQEYEESRTHEVILRRGACVRTDQEVPAVVQHRDSQGWYHLQPMREAAGGVWVHVDEGAKSMPRVRSYDVMREPAMRPEKWAEDMQGMLIEVCKLMSHSRGPSFPEGKSLLESVHAQIA
jgi:hypothetical protein